MEYKNTRNSIYYPIILAFAIVIGILIGRYYKSNYSERRFYIYPRADKLNNILNYIEKEYVDHVSKKDLVESTIPKLLEELDPHSQYIPAEDLQRINEPLEGNFSGIGVQFNLLNDTLVIINTVANGPSEKIGILAGDRIIKVNNKTVAGVKMPSDSIVKRLRGPKGSKVNIEILRRNIDELLSFEIIRDNIPLYSVDVGYMITDEIGYIKINSFSRTTYEEFVSAFGELRSEGLKKLVLDLRNNGGGYMDAAVNIADQFLNNKELIVYTEGNARAREEYRSKPGGICNDVEVVILIDESSASASEILAGAIQDNDRGLVIGRRSFGKGLVQEQKLLSDSSAIRLTIARYYTPTGRSIQKPYNKGIEDYINDLNNRYIRGEFSIEDSIHLNDSLKYRTPGGKIVFGGGGIMPDIFVPIDTIDVTDYLINVRNRGLLYSFALKFADENRVILEKFQKPEEFVKYLSKRNVLGAFIQYARSKGVEEIPDEIKTSEEILKTQLYANITRNILDNKGYYPIIKTIDNTLQKAIAILENNTG
jgi:carboxyl-terminal processing protease